MASASNPTTAQLYNQVVQCLNIDPPNADRLYDVIQRLAVFDEDGFKNAVLSLLVQRISVAAGEIVLR